ncbi:MAG: tryptophan 7-halogenase, partial [Pseudomonadota bacterium]
MESKKITKVVIAGGGTAGWITAALLNKVLGKVIEITLVESAEMPSAPFRCKIGGMLASPTPTVPISAKEFIKATGATIKLGIEFENWRSQGH